MNTDPDVERADEPLDLSRSEAELEARRDHVTDFVADWFDAAGADRAVLGLSGGVDSTLVAHLAVEALGADRVHGLVMPSEVDTEDDTSDGERVAELLEIDHDLIGIEPIVEAVLEGYPDAEGDRVAVGNLRVRCRAVLNYLVANHRNALVVGTGNRSEALVGYYTKYGDGAVDCQPIANLYKAEVRQLAEHVGVPADLARRTASAGMWVGQTDEAELGVDYPTLDSILALHVEGGLSATATAREIGVDVDLVESVRAMYQDGEHKRRMPSSPDPQY